MGPTATDIDRETGGAVARLASVAVKADTLECVLTQATTVVEETLPAETVAVFEREADALTLRASLGEMDNSSAAEVADDPARLSARSSAIEAFECPDAGVAWVGYRCRLEGPAGTWGELVVVGRERLRAESTRKLLASVVEVLESRLAREPQRRAQARRSSGLCSLDQQCRLTYADDRARASFGEPAASGDPLWAAFPAACESRLRSVCQQAMETGESQWLTVNRAHGASPLRLDPGETGLTVTVYEADEAGSLQAELREQNRTLQTLSEITADRNRSFEDKLTDLLELGRKRLDLEIGFVANVDQETDRFEVVQAIGDDRLEAGAETSLSETYCRRTIQAEDLLVLTNTPETEGWADDEAYARWDFDSYVGGKVHVDGQLYGTLCFADDAPTPDQFSTGQLRFVNLAIQWLGLELERQHNQAELEAALEELATSNERLEQFAYVTSHDLQEPLRTVSNYLQLIERQCGGALDEDGEEFLAFALDGAERMREMIDGLLRLSRVETRGEPLSPTDLTDVLAAVEQDVALQLEETAATLSVGDLPTVNGDERQLRQLFQNLLSNALTYCGESPPVVRIDAERDGDSWHVWVDDEGIGMPAEETSYVFEVFGRLHSHAEQPGTGIGLAICQRIVDRHDGEIWIEAEPDAGTTVHLRLPSAD